MVQADGSGSASDELRRYRCQPSHTHCTGATANVVTTACSRPQLRRWRQMRVQVRATATLATIALAAVLGAHYAGYLNTAFVSQQPRYGLALHLPPLGTPTELPRLPRGFCAGAVADSLPRFLCARMAAGTEDVIGLDVEDWEFDGEDPEGEPILIPTEPTLQEKVLNKSRDMAKLALEAMHTSPDTLMTHLTDMAGNKRCEESLGLAFPYLERTFGHGLSTEEPTSRSFELIEPEAEEEEPKALVSMTFRVVGPLNEGEVELKTSIKKGETLKMESLKFEGESMLPLTLAEELRILEEEREALLLEEGEAAAER